MASRGGSGPGRPVPSAAAGSSTNRIVMSGPSMSAPPAGKAGPSSGSRATSASTVSATQTATPAAPVLLPEEERKDAPTQLMDTVKRRTSFDATTRAVGGGQGRATQLLGATGKIDAAALAADPLWYRRSYLQYTYAIFLKRKAPDVDLVHTKIIQFLGVSGLSVAVLENQENRDLAVLLVTADPDVSEGLAPPPVLRKENDKLFVERYLKFGASPYPEPPDNKDMTTAKRLQLTHRMIVRALDAVTFELHQSIDFSQSKQNMLRDPQLKGMVTSWDYVDQVFPLHDEHWNDIFIQQYARTVFKWQSWVPTQFVEWWNGRNVVAQLYAALPDADMQDLDKANAKQPFNPHWPIEALRCHLGERCAFYFAFLSHYTAWLLPLAIICSFLYFIARYISWPAYVRGLGIVGVSVVAIWAPLVLAYWRQHSNTLGFFWGLRGVSDEENPNLEAKFVIAKQDDGSGETYRKFDPHNNRGKIKWGLVPFMLLNGLLMMVIVLPFTQVFVQGKLAPDCACCHWHMRTHGNATIEPLPKVCTIFEPQIYTYTVPTTCREVIDCYSSSKPWRSIILALQGTLLGIVLDRVLFARCVQFTTWLTKQEHWPTEAQFERHCIRKQFIFMWINMFMWFLSLAFILIPFGAQVQQALRNAGLGVVTPYYGWRFGVINLDEAFVGPLVVTQALGLFLETGLPYIKMRIAARLAAKKKAKAAAATTTTTTPNGPVTAKSNSQDSVAVTPVESTAKKSKSVAHRAGALTASSSAEQKDTWTMQDVERVEDIDLPEDSTPTARKAQLRGNQGTAASLVPYGSAKSLDSQVERFDSNLHLLNSPTAASPDENLPFSEALIAAVAARHKLRLPMIRYTADPNRMDYEKVLEQSQRTPFHPRDDYLDNQKQLGLVLMFTGVWSFAPLASLLNNMIELRSDAFKLLREMRRPVPRQDNGIGEWEDVFHYSIALAMPVVAALFVVATGALEWYMVADCRVDDEGMRPDWNCLDNWPIRLLVGVLLERTGVLLYTFINSMAAIPQHVQKRIEAEEASQRQTVADQLLNSLPPTVLEDLRFLFRIFDQDHNGVLSGEELFALLDLLTNPVLAMKHKQMLLDMIDVDDNNTVTYAEFGTALQRCADDFVLREVLNLANLMPAISRLAQGVRQGKLGADASDWMSSDFNRLARAWMFDPSNARDNQLDAIAAELSDSRVIDAEDDDDLGYLG